MKTGGKLVHSFSGRMAATMRCALAVLSVAGVSGLSAPAAVPNVHALLAAAPGVIRVSDSKLVRLTDEWKRSERAAVFFFRSFG